MVRPGGLGKVVPELLLIVWVKWTDRVSILLDSWTYSLAGWETYDLWKSVIRDQNPSTTGGGPSRLWRPVSEDLVQP